jgi:hypothetical protein
MFFIEMMINDGLLGVAQFSWIYRKSHWFIVRSHSIPLIFHMEVSWNRGTPKPSIFIDGFSLINHPFWGTPQLGNPHIWTSSQNECQVFVRDLLWQAQMSVMDSRALRVKDVSVFYHKETATFTSHQSINTPLTHPLGMLHSHIPNFGGPNLACRRYTWLLTVFDHLLAPSAWGMLGENPHNLKKDPNKNIMR